MKSEMLSGMARLGVEMMHLQNGEVQSTVEEVIEKHRKLEKLQEYISE